ncbi:hypothetical protein JRQ81_004878 [Phrynocephalus forsythii]|uniref:Uncharacterized protein n=1 Tax=Phrynocephalus forsythii TaxID=171643 RepID=A0A9Q0XG26_9SAUR|nr:hypothetical protein JRQ81_004878 [Phrynocephalus forsythii]
MSSQSKGEPNPESKGDSKPAADGSATNMYYDKERSLKEKHAPVVHEDPRSVKRPFSKHIRSLKDLMKDPKREEPLVGLEYILEIRFQGRKMPFYECQLCHFNMELLPMIEHVTGQKHRKRYLTKHYPEKVKRNPNDCKEDKNSFFKRISREVEKTEGLKMYKRETHERPSVATTPAEKKARFSRGYRPENDPVRRQKALEYMENFEIKSDQEAALVISLAQSLSKDLKAFCERIATLNYIKTLPSLLSPEITENQYNPINSIENYQDQPGDTCTVSDGLAKLYSLLQQVPSTSHTHADSYDYQLRKPSLHGLCSKDFATVSALRSSFDTQPGGSHSGMNEWMKQFSQSASAFFQSTPAEEEFPHFRSGQRSYTMQCNQEDNIMIDNRMKKWDNVKVSHDSETLPLDLNSYLPPKVYQASYPTRRRPSRFHDEPENSDLMHPPSSSSESRGPSWPQQPDYHPSSPESYLESYSTFSGGSSHRDYQQQNAQLDYVMDGHSSDLTNLMNQLRGQDAATLGSMLEQLLPHYPDLQKINIHALAQALSEMN